jgi:hypothetical protein
MTTTELGSAFLAKEAGRRVPMSTFRKAFVFGCAAIIALMPTTDAFAQAVRCGALGQGAVVSEEVLYALSNYNQARRDEYRARETMRQFRCHVRANQGSYECIEAIAEVQRTTDAVRRWEQHLQSRGGVESARRTANQFDRRALEECRRRVAAARVHDFDDNPNPRRPSAEESVAVMIGALGVGMAIAGARGRGGGIGRGPAMHGGGMHRR